ncbi:DUF421 domain-containing protein [Sporosarcina sp. Marseille-Q4063]|uniref:DUF421 domain-containing protein n=1 Tax=Sporosarcina sp. Marseille-Q4063 TaxID=2810514 RepID=UPI001BB080B0|nr:DUF421 domain-containing protein [Sporosarcina sp. Marseille-Q4063]QUW22533.1 DUF421 domain-containing protein [Sporosarcina sp. Marseille-Q4063]
MDYLLIGAKLLVGFIALMTVLRVLGKKHLSQMTPYDIIYLLVFGGILEESIFDDKVSIFMLLFGVAVWAIVIYIIEKVVTKSNKLRILLKGEPDKIIANGKLNKKLIDKNQLEMEQLRTMLRMHGIFSLREVRDLYIEPGGEISINQYAQYKGVTNEDMKLKIDEEDPTILLVDEGQIKEDALDSIGKSKQWLKSELEQLGYANLKELLYCEWSRTEGFFIKKQPNRHKK